MAEVIKSNKQIDLNIKVGANVLKDMHQNPGDCLLFNSYYRGISGLGLSKLVEDAFILTLRKIHLAACPNPASHL